MIISLLVDINRNMTSTGIINPKSHELYNEMMETCTRIGVPQPKERVSGFINGHKLTASLESDNEENAVRLAEQLVREAFAKLREQNAKNT